MNEGCPLIIDMVCSCGGELHIELSSRAPDSIYDVDKFCRLAQAWNEAHRGHCYKKQKEPQ